MPRKYNDKWDFPWYTTRERLVTILCHAIEITGANTIYATYTRRMMGKLHAIPLNMKRLSVFGLVVFSLAWYKTPCAISTRVKVESYIVTTSSVRQV